MNDVLLRLSTKRGLDCAIGMIQDVIARLEKVKTEVPENVRPWVEMAIAHLRRIKSRMLEAKEDGAQDPLHQVGKPFEVERVAQGKP